MARGTGRPWVSNSPNIQSKGSTAPASRRVGSADSIERRAMAKAAPTTPTPTPTPTPTTDTFSQQIDYGQPTPAIQTAAQPDLSEDTLRKTAEFMARERALAEQLDLFRSQQATGRTRFEEDLTGSFRDLGYDPTNQSFDLGQLLSSGQRATASGKAYNALRNDFAARGMLQSGAYQAQRAILTEQLLKQARELEGRRTRFTEDQTAALQAQEQQAEAQRTAALEEAKQAILARMGMGG